MGHQHEHHSHHEAAPSETSMSFEEKAAKLIAHWIHHNNDHGQNYARWVDDFKAHGFHEAAETLAAAEALTRQITETLNLAASQIPPNKASDTEKTG
jgi:hypothetical protein